MVVAQVLKHGNSAYIFGFLPLRKLLVSFGEVLPSCEGTLRNTAASNQDSRKQVAHLPQALMSSQATMQT